MTWRDPCDDREAARRSRRRRQKAIDVRRDCVAEAQGAYAALPKLVRRDITDRFKAARAAAPATAWGDWLIAELEANHGLSL